MPAPTPLPHANLPAPLAQANVTPLAVPPSAAGHMLSLSLSEVYERMRNGELDSYADGRARPGVGIAGPKLKEHSSGLTGSFSKTAKKIKPQGGFVTPGMRRGGRRSAPCVRELPKEL
jgi:hypothetical protein